MRNQKHSFFRLLFGIVFQIAFAEGFLLIVRHFLAEDPDALAMYPKVRIGMYIFWTPFMLHNIYEYIRDWRIEAAMNKIADTGVDIAKKAAKKKAAEEARQRLRRKVDVEKTDRAKEQAELERERAERDRQNREWQERTTKEQREQNAEQSKYCVFCGAKIPRAAKFCTQCGASQEE